MVPLKAQLTKLHDQEGSHQQQLEIREARLIDIEVEHYLLKSAAFSVPFFMQSSQCGMWTQSVCVLRDSLLHIC